MYLPSKWFQPITDLHSDFLLNFSACWRRTQKHTIQSTSQAPSSTTPALTSPDSQAETVMISHGNPSTGWRANNTQQYSRAHTPQPAAPRGRRKARAGSYLVKKARKWQRLWFYSVSICTWIFKGKCFRVQNKVKRVKSTFLSATSCSVIVLSGL